MDLISGSENTMGSHIIDILRQGIWASLSGGWFYDPHQSIFSNTFHLYVWMGLLAFPLILHLTLESSLVIWLIYCGILAAVFIIIKAFNFRLHHMFDTSEVIEEITDDKNGSRDSDKGSKELGSSSSRNPEVIELQTIKPASAVDQDEVSLTKQHDRTSLRSLDAINNNEDHTEHGGAASSESSRVREIPRKGHKRSGPAPLAELEADGMDNPGSSRKSARADIGKRPTGTEKEHADTTAKGPNQITTKADIELNPDLSDGEIELYKPTLPCMLKEETDSDFSPEGGPRIRKRRKAVRRSKSALETTEDPKIKQPKQDQSKNALTMPPDTRYNFSLIREMDEGNVPIFRPRSAQNITRRRTKEPDKEMTVVDLENVAETRTAPVRPKVPSARVRVLDRDRQSVNKDRRKNRSLSVDESLIGFRPRIPTPHVATLEVEKKRFLEKYKKSADSVKDRDTKNEILDKENANIAVETDRTDISDESGATADTSVLTTETQLDTSHSSDISFGEFVIDDMIVDSKLEQLKSKPRPSSAGASPRNINKDKSVSVNPQNLSNKLLFVGNTDSKNQDSASQQSSTVGLDWLFNSDSDSTSGDGEQSRPRERYLSDTSSTMTNEGESTFDTSPEHPVQSQPLSESKATQSSSKTTTTEELEIMRKQGAIPKTYPTRPLPAIPGTSTHDETTDQHSGSPSSGDLSDREDFRKKILEILSDPSDNPEQMRKLFKAVIEAKGNRRAMRSSGRQRLTSYNSRSSGRQKSAESGDSAVPGSSHSSAVATPGAEDHDRSSDSKSNTPTESSALLPPIVIGSSRRARVHQRHRNGRKTRLRRRNNNTNSQPNDPTNPPVPSTMGSSFHVAKSHDDTTEGAVHWFQDESGNWFSYTFGENSTGLAFNVNEHADPVVNWNDKRWSTSSSGSGSTIRYSMIDDSPKVPERKDDPMLNDIDPPGVINRLTIEQLLAGTGGHMPTCDSSTDSDTPDFMSSKEKPKHFYNFELFPKKFVKIRFDRLALLALLDM